MKIRVPWRVRRALRWIWSRDVVLIFQIGADEAPRVDPATERTDIVFTSTPRQVLTSTSAKIPARLLQTLADFGPDSVVHLAEVDGVIVSWGVSAIASHWHVTETDTSLKLPDHTACLMAFETQLAHRGKGLYTALLRQILRTHFAAGAQWAYIWCEQDNRASRAAISRVGFRVIGQHRRKTLLGLSRRSVATLR